MDFLPLSFLFIGAGLVAIGYYRIVPEIDILRSRLPNKITGAGLLLAAVISIAFWYIFSTTFGFWRVVLIFTLLFALLVFESFFLLIIRIFKSNSLAVIMALLMVAGLFLFHITFPTFALRNAIIVLATLGATTLLIRLGYLKTWLMFVFAILWSVYDIFVTRYFFPKVLVPVTEPQPFFFFPAVIIGTVSLGSGDFIFLALFTLIMLRDFGLLPSLLLLVAETVALLITGLLITGSDFILPFLAIMTPIFFLIYFISYIFKKNKQTHA